MESIQQLIYSSELPILSAFILGLMTSISPCTLAPNISAIGFISRDLKDSKKTFINGLLYTLGRCFSYTILGIILITILKQGEDVFKIQKLFSIYGEMFIGPILIIFGIFMLDIIHIKFPQFSRITSKAEQKTKSKGKWSSFLLGTILALAFCPYCAFLYFGLLIPVAVTTPTGYIQPFIFAIATGLPVILFAWLISYGMSHVSSTYNKMKKFEYWFRRIVAIIFILTGLYYVNMYFF